MAGVFDLFSDDPGQAANMMLAAGLLSGRGSFNQILGNSLAQAQGTYANALEQKQQGKIKSLQTKQIEDQLSAAEELRRRTEEFRRSIPSPEMQASQAALSAGGGPTMINAQKIAPTDPTTSFMFKAMQAGQLSPLDYVKMTQKDSSPIKLGAGEKLLKPGSFATLAENPRETDSRTADQKDYAAAVLQGYKGNFIDYQREMANLKAPRTKVEVPINMGQRGFENTLKLRSDFRSEPIYKAHQEVQSAHAQIKAGIKSESPAGDLAAATKIMKILDPTSVVRESELGMAIAATGLFDRLAYYADHVIKGTKLTPSQRKDFGQLADSLASESAKQYNAKRLEYKGIVDRNQLNEADVIGTPADIKPITDDGWSIRPKP